LLEVSIEGAKGVIFNVTGGTDLTLKEVHEASQVVSRMVDPDANIIFGTVTDPKMENEVKMTVIATGFPGADGETDQQQLLAAQLKDVLANEGQLDLPPFLRNRRSAYARTRNGAGVPGA
jgi:cell division protein FtsZ